MDSRRRIIVISVVAVIVIVIVVAIVFATCNTTNDPPPPSGGTPSGTTPPTQTKPSNTINVGNIADILTTSDNKTIVALPDIGVIRLVDSGTDYKLPPPPNAAADVTSTPSCLAEINASTLAVGTEDGCIYKFNRDSGIFNLVIDNSDKLDSVDGFSNMAVYEALAVSSSGQLYAANYSIGVVEVYDSSTFVFMGVIALPSSYAPLGLVIDASQKLFVLCINVTTLSGVIVQNGANVLANINQPVSIKLCGGNKLQLATTSSVTSYDITSLDLLNTTQLGETITALSCSQVAQNGSLISY